MAQLSAEPRDNLEPWNLLGVSAAEQLDQFTALTIGEACEGLCRRDSAADEQAIGAGRTDPRGGQQQLMHLRRLRTGRRVGNNPAHPEAARRDASLQLGALDANLVRLRKRAQPLLTRASKPCRSASHNNTTPILRAAAAKTLETLRSVSTQHRVNRCQC
jgi:hypothetical protein